MPRMGNGVSLVALLTFTSASEADESTAEAKRLAGVWSGTGGVWKGKPLAAEQARQSVLILRLPRPDFDLSGGPRGMDLLVSDIAELKDYSCALSPSSGPPTLRAYKHIGLKGHGVDGIYKAQGDTLTICINFARFQALPKEFLSPEGSEVLLLTFKRGR